MGLAKHSPPFPIRAAVECDYYDGIETGFLALAEPKLAFVIRRLARRRSEWLYIAWPLPEAVYEEIAAMGEPCPNPVIRFFSLEHPTEQGRLDEIVAMATHDAPLLFELDLEANVVATAYRVERHWADRPSV